MMRAVIRAVVMCASLLSLVAAVSPAFAADAELPADWDKCMEQPDDEVDPFAEPPTCTFDSEGRLISRDVRSGMSAIPGFGTFLVIAVLWALIPLAIAASLASSRGESVGMAIILTLALGWIGLAIVAFGQSRTATAGRTLFTEPPTATADPDDVAERLRRLDDLHARGVISSDERERRRQELIDEL